MKKGIIINCLAIFFLISMRWSYAEVLLQVYRTALVNDPAFKKAEADWLSAREALPIAMTGTGEPGSGLFPFIDAGAFGNRAYDRTLVGNTLTRNGHFNVGDYSVTITQPLFNYATWKAISRAGFEVKSATATFLFAIQDLMFRASQAYFIVLRDYNNLQIVETKRAVILKQLAVAKQRLKIGLEAITDVYDVESRYYRAVTEVEGARKTLAQAIEDLYAITGVKYASLKDLRWVIPLVVPEPASQHAWVEVAEDQNYQIHANLYAMLAARERIKEVSAANWPTLNAEAAFETLDEGAVSGGMPRSRRGVRTNQVGLALSFPIFQGGHVLTTTKQAQYEYLAASDQLEFSRFRVRKTTGQAFIRVQEGIRQIESAAKAVLASRKDLEATQISYLVGNRSMIDVLINVEQLYNTMQVWNDQRSEYVISLVQLKQQAGTLSPRDLAILNQWLGGFVSLLDLQKPTNGIKKFSPPDLAEKIKRLLRPRSSQSPLLPKNHHSRIHLKSLEEPVTKPLTHFAPTHVFFDQSLLPVLELPSPRRSLPILPVPRSTL